MFDFNPLEVGNPMTLGLAEEENKQNAYRAYCHLKSVELYNSITKKDIDYALNDYNVDYFSLDREAKDWFNEFDI